MKKILFQGDSITDCLRDRSVDRLLGQGYAFAVAARLGYEQPGRFAVLNRGISGDRVVDLYARCKRDCWNLLPDYLSILIGVNDVWHEFNGKNGVEIRRYEEIYRRFLAETRERLPHCRIILMEPFVLPGTGVNEYGYSAFRAEIALRQQAVRGLAEEFGVSYLPLQDALDEAAARLSPEYWLVDGIHPTPAGHGLIAARWLELFQQICEEERLRKKDG